MTLTDKVNAIQRSGTKPCILVIGDLMVDHYIWGGATRLSPEAPVPIVNVKNDTHTPGGAANLAQNLVSLGANVQLSGVIGADTAGEQLSDLLSSEDISTNAILTDATRPTTVKSRVIVGNHQLVRIDREVTNYLTADLEEKLFQQLNPQIADADMVVLSDYNKGLLSPALSQKIISTAKQQGKKVIVDPKGLDYAKYQGAFIIKPNKKELAEAAKKEKIGSNDELIAAARTVIAQTGTEYIVVTLSEEGMAIISANDNKLLPVKATEVFDVTGAGDTVLAAIAYFIAAGLSIEEACELANHAAAIVIRHLGSATTTINEILADIANDNR